MHFPTAAAAYEALKENYAVASFVDQHLWAAIPNDWMNSPANKAAMDKLYKEIGAEWYMCPAWGGRPMLRHSASSEKPRASYM